jgi:tRNA (mo5U34)-methyltransferase
MWPFKRKRRTGMTTLIRNPVVSQADAQKLVDGTTWYHRIEVVPGVVSPGRVPSEGTYDAVGYIDSLGLGKDLKGARILEIGAWDGPLSFELKQRGADVVAADIQDPARTGFNALKAISGLDIPYFRSSVYEIDQLGMGQFDIVLFMGVFYHLKHPLLAFEKIANVTKLDGTLFTVGAGLGGEWEDLEMRKIAPDDIDEIVATLERLDKLGVPLTLSYPGTYLAGENWFLPNRTALSGWLKNAGFEPQNVYTLPTWGRSVVAGAMGVKKRETFVREHSLTGEAGDFYRISKL